VVWQALTQNTQWYWLMHMLSRNLRLTSYPACPISLCFCSQGRQEKERKNGALILHCTDISMPHNYPNIRYKTWFLREQNIKLKLILYQYAWRKRTQESSIQWADFSGKGAGSARKIAGRGGLGDHDGIMSNLKLW
jgi:hypothetical protein